MITKILNIFYDEAQKHVLFKSFNYSTHTNYGEGNELLPQLWLEAPLRGVTQSPSQIRHYLNFAVLVQAAEYNSVADAQETAYSAAVNIIEHIKRIHKNILTIISWDYITLEDYYDNGSAGVRISLTVDMYNDINLCRIPEQYDEEKTLPTPQALPDFKTTTVDKCAVFDDKIPQFKLKTR